MPRATAKESRYLCAALSQDVMRRSLSPNGLNL